MNEIITRLNEIEQKADAIISDAKSRKDEMLTQLELDKREMDEKYEQLERKKEEQLRGQFLGGTEKEISRLQEESRQEIAELEENFSRRKEQQAEEIFQRIIQRQ